MAVNAKLAESIVKIADRFKSEMDRGQREGRLTEDGRLGVLMSSMLRAIDRAADLPDDRDLTDTEVETLQASLLQVSAASLALLDELPFPGMHVMVAAFDMRRPS